MTTVPSLSLRGCFTCNNGLICDCEAKQLWGSERKFALNSLKFILSSVWHTDYSKRSHLLGGAGLPSQLCVIYQTKFVSPIKNLQSSGVEPRSVSLWSEDYRCVSSEWKLCRWCFHGVLLGALCVSQLMKLVINLFFKIGLAYWGMSLACSSLKGNIVGLSWRSFFWTTLASLLPCNLDGYSNVSEVFMVVMSNLRPHVYCHLKMKLQSVQTMLHSVSEVISFHNTLKNTNHTTIFGHWTCACRCKQEAECLLFA